MATPAFCIKEFKLPALTVFTTAVAAAVVVNPPPVKVTVALATYPLPGFVIVILRTVPVAASKLAVPVACVPVPVGAAITTVGAEV